uniref:Conserved uncharacterized protein n=1 Tax=Clytia hemisphaerica TaxID=252671 RepID=A0A069DMF7_9CNID
MDRKATLNIQNLDNRCFMWCILVAKYNVEKHAERASKYNKYINKLKMDGIKYPVGINEIKCFERLNNISVDNQESFTLASDMYSFLFPGL